MRDSIWYEWVIEEIIVHGHDEHGIIEDIEENFFGDKLTDYYLNEVRDAIEKRRISGEETKYTMLGIIYHLGNEDDGELDRDYAYVDEGKLPECFEFGRKIPQRFHKELAAFQKRLMKEVA